MKPYIFLYILLLANISPKSTITNCLECAKANSGKNFMCYSPFLFKEKWKVKCCEPGASDINCKKSPVVNCTEPFNENPASFYS